MAFDDPSLFINRELSMLAFQRRVLEEADDRSLPIFERLKFLGIVSSNLDEYFMVRASGVKQQLVVGVLEKSAEFLARLVKPDFSLPMIGDADFIVVDLHPNQSEYNFSTATRVGIEELVARLTFSGDFFVSFKQGDAILFQRVPSH